MNYTTVYLSQNHPISIPDVILSPQQNYTYRAMCGFSSLLAAQNENGEWVGCVSVLDLGFETVKVWLSVNGAPHD